MYTLRIANIMARPRIASNDLARQSRAVGAKFAPYRTVANTGNSTGVIITPRTNNPTAILPANNLTLSNRIVPIPLEDKKLQTGIPYIGPNTTSR